MNTNQTYRDTSTLSLPREKTIRGYTIRRMPIGQFLCALERLREMPGEALDILLPGLNPQTLVSRFKTLTAEELKAAAVRLMTLLPAYGVGLLAGLTGISERDLLQDELLGLDGLMELLDGWMELNGIGNFIRAAGALRDKVRSITIRNGCKGSSQGR